jgi:excinuclease UvrABC helicase subunit UvrB
VRFRGKESEDVLVGDEPSQDERPNAASSDRESRDADQHEDPFVEQARLRAEVSRLELELQRHREHAQRTSRLFLSVTKYADWVRENARRDAELALRKARARAEKLDVLEHEREQTEHEVERLRDELARLQALTDETRARLSAFLTAGLEALTADAEVKPEDGLEAAVGDLEDTLKERLSSTPVQTAQRES